MRFYVLLVGFKTERGFDSIDDANAHARALRRRGYRAMVEARDFDADLPFAPPVPCVREIRWAGVAP